MNKTKRGKEGERKKEIGHHRKQTNKQTNKQIKKL